MPTATAFKYPKLFSPVAHCIESKTTTELNAMSLSRYESTLANIMALWWNLYTVDISVTESGESTESYTSQSVRDLEGSFSSWGAAAALTPLDRVCAQFNSGSPYDGLVVGEDFDDHNGDGGGPLMITFQRVYLNSTTGNYALMFLLVWNTPSGNVLATAGFGDANGTPGTSNGGTVTFLGQTIATNRSSAIADTTVTISSPAYYTY